MLNSSFYPTPANPYAWNNNYASGVSYAPQIGGYNGDILQHWL